MIFRPRLIHAIAQGKKTMTRRPLKSNDEVCRYRVGHDYAIQPGRGKPAVARITITDVRRERLGELTFNDARAEGFRTRAEFFEYWEQLYGRVDVDELVWVITFEVAENIRLLHKDSTRGYTANPEQAVEGEPEAVDAETMERYARQGHARWTEDHREEVERREARARAAKLQETQVRAAKRGVDVGAEVAMIDTALERMRRKVGQAA
ncbi:MAG: ASCH domain-containing protein [Actinomycetota bacterium]|nr:ASCH domain-containing protein [Actinomycetota bacterium]